MRLSRMVGRRIKESPRDAVTASHIFLIRGGYVRPVSAGIYSLLPLGKRIIDKIETIIREEMLAIDGQEVLMPVVLPAELWEESGRYDSVGAELLRFKDRNGKRMLLGMTHEEAVVHLCRSEVSSYKQLPVMLWQLQTKYRDDARPRAGLIRVREFTMKDAYSFHSSQKCLEEYYQRAHAAYVRIFQRLGMKNVLSILSDTGMMGGTMAHEFEAVADCGEDTIFMSPDGRYKANREVARMAMTWDKAPELPLEKVHTPGKQSIEDLSSFLGVAPQQTGKVVFYVDDDNKLVLVMLRGDLEVNDTKIRNFLRVKELRFANDEQIRAAGAVPGYASPLGLDPRRVRMVIDPSAKESSNLVVGANEPDYHCRNFNFARDLAAIADQVSVQDIVCAVEGAPCPLTGQPLKMVRGIEVGNIFQLGIKYSQAMNCNFLDENGAAKPMIMGCYGIGVGRSMASVIEQNHDEHGPVWPMSIAPFHVHLCALRLADETVKQDAEALYRELGAAGLEVLYDDRNEKAGFMFADADLIGAPLRLIVSPKTVADKVVEFKTRDGQVHELVPRGEVVARMKALVADALAQLNR